MADPNERDDTTAWLSDLMKTVDACHSAPQMAIAMTIGTSCLAAICTWDHVCGH